MEIPEVQNENNLDSDDIVYQSPNKDDSHKKII